MMKKPFIVLYCVLLLNCVFNLVAWKGWNMFFYFILPVAIMGQYIISLAFISGDNDKIIYSAPLVPKFMKKALMELGVSFKRDFPVLYHKEESA